MIKYLRILITQIKTKKTIEVKEIRSKKCHDNTYYIYIYVHTRKYIYMYLNLNVRIFLNSVYVYLTFL